MTARRAAVGFLFLAGCVVPPEIETARPPPGNQPPFVLRAWPEPGLIKVDIKCITEEPKLTFTLQGISDCDAGDTVSVRWFVDYDPEHPSKEGSFVSDFRGGPGLSQCVRSPSSVSFKLPDRATVAGARTVHLEAVLSDGFAASDSDPQFRSALPGKAITRIGWTVELIDGTGCPR